MKHTCELAGYGVAAAMSAVLIAGSLVHRIPLDPAEVLGFVSGGLCVWLTVRESIWNWPTGIANSAFFLILFLQSRLFADMALQGVYIVLGFLGWYWWLRGGDDRAPLPISRIGPAGAMVLAALGALSIWTGTLFLQSVGDSAPFWDAVTTVLSLIAQYLLTRKVFENWSVWIAADVIYVGLYSYKHLLLTAVLYVVFVGMCVAGYVQWGRSLSASRPYALEGGAVHG